MMLCGATVGMILVLVIGGIEQSTKLSFGAFPSFSHCQHVQIEKRAERHRVRVRYNHIDK